MLKQTPRISVLVRPVLRSRKEQANAVVRDFVESDPAG